MLWPADEPWPLCPGDHALDQDGPDPLPLIAGVQVYLRDAPSLPHPPGVDLPQMMWCPTLGIEADDHTADGHLQVFWRPIEDEGKTSYDDRRLSQLAADLDIGRGYALQTYYCTADWTHPIARYMQ
ncbi:hypothetical protein SAMN05428985_106130 [Nocardioides sp. YR527]|uniref:hypothetical protein n=1 Tax=Nocardioides sp. YR527 TaxID=1881028 RepID=UPI00088A085F|nr:hypothetical protein [Nocardioides sp. YR527]SDK79989.1 hypothetical protein SAMN05428985_106130 [Nocardioides sp. YR527]